MRQPRVFVGRAFVIPPREVAHGEWRPPPGSSRPDGRSELHRQPDREPAGADRPDANPRWGLDCPPMLAPDNRTDDRAQDHPGGHRDDKQPAYQAATSPAGDDRGEYAERRPAEEAKGDAATPMSAAACARAPADLEPRPALARESHRRAVRTSHDDGGAVDRFETPGPHVAPPVGRGDADASARGHGGRLLGAERPDANPRWGLDWPPMLAPDNRTDDRAQDRPGGHGDNKGQPAQFAAVAAAHPDETGGYAERRPAEEAKGDAATPPSSPAACARAPADLELRAALAWESHRRAVRTPYDDGGAVDRFETPGPHVAPPVGRGDANPNARSQGGRFLGAESAERQAQREREAGADAFYGSPPAGENSGSVSSGFQERPPVTLSHSPWSERRGALQRPVPPVAFPPVRAAKTPYN